MRRTSKGNLSRVEFLKLISALDPFSATDHRKIALYSTYSADLLGLFVAAFLAGRRPHRGALATFLFIMVTKSKPLED